MKKIVSIALIVTFIFVMAVSAAAEPSPPPKDFYNITVTVDGTGEASAKPYRVEKNTDGTMTLTVDDPGVGFIRWIINGKYEIVSGSLTSATLVIRPLSDIDAVAVFKDGKKNGGGGGQQGKGNSSNTSPKTGDVMALAIILMMLSLGGGIIATKKLKG